MAAWDDGKSLFKVLLRWPEFCCSEDTVLFCPSSWNDWMEVSPRGTFLLLIHKITNRTRRFQGNLVAPNKFKEEEGMDAIKPGSSWFYKVYEMNTTLELVKDTDHPSMPVQISSCTFESKVPPSPEPTVLAASWLKVSWLLHFSHQLIIWRDRGIFVPPRVFPEFQNYSHQKLPLPFLREAQPNWRIT